MAGENDAAVAEPQEPQEPTDAPDTTDELTVREAMDAEIAASEDPSAIDQAIAEARERLDSGEGLVPADEADEEAEPPPDEGEPADDLEAGDEPPPEPEEELPEEEPGEEEEPEEEEPEEEGVELVKLPARHPEEPDEEWEIDNPELAERIRQLRNGYVRGNEARAIEQAAEERVEAVQQAEEEYGLMDQELEADPAQFLMERVHPDLRTEVALALLSDEKVFEDPGVQDALREWEIDPSAREDFHSENAEERAEKAEKRRQEYRREVRTRNAVRNISRIVRDTIPEAWEEEKRNRYFRVALREIEDFALDPSRGRPTLDLDREDIIGLLDERGILDRYEIDPGSNGKKPFGSGGRRRASGSSRSSGSSGDSDPSVEDARDTGKRLQERSKRRREAAAVSPAGAGAPAARIELPRHQTVEERIEFIEKKGGVGAFT